MPKYAAIETRIHAAANRGFGMNIDGLILGLLLLIGSPGARGRVC